MKLDKDVNDELEKRFDTSFNRFFDLYADVLVSSKLIDASEINYIKLIMMKSLRKRSVNYKILMILKKGFII